MFYHCGMFSCGFARMTHPLVEKKLIQQERYANLKCATTTCMISGTRILSEYREAKLQYCSSSS
jgi:hypothetical protein